MKRHKRLQDLKAQQNQAYINSKYFTYTENHLSHILLPEFSENV